MMESGETSNTVFMDAILDLTRQQLILASLQASLHAHTPWTQLRVCITP